MAELTAWPEFHNGVAAGLRLAPGEGGTPGPPRTPLCWAVLRRAHSLAGAGGHQLTRTWIVYNKPPEPSYTHAGLLMALGLSGARRRLRHHGSCAGCSSSCATRLVQAT